MPARLLAQGNWGTETVQLWTKRGLLKLFAQEQQLRRLYSETQAYFWTYVLSELAQAVFEQQGAPQLLFT